MRPAFLLSVCALLLSGCLSEPLVLRGPNQNGLVFKADHVVHAFDNDSNLTVVLIEGELDAPARAAVVRLLWRGRAARTPTEHSATNASIHALNFGGNGVSIWEGAAYCMLSGDLEDTLDINITDADTVLADASPGRDGTRLMGSLRGDLHSRHDPALTAHLTQLLSRLATERLGYPRLVGTEMRSEKGEG